MMRIGVDLARSVEVPHSYERVLSTSTTSDVDDEWVSQAVKVDAARAILRTWKTSVEDLSALNASDVWMRSSRTILKSAVTIWSSALTIDASGAESSETAMFSELSRAKGMVASYEKAGRPQLASFYLGRCQAPSATAESLKGVAGLGELFQHGLVDGDRRVEAVDGARAV
ncbi:hypothetical protein QZM74_11030, partial [Burkholderia multivorans]|nr:hypothetical protein [Burkholderia multivorans]